MVRQWPLTWIFHTLRGKGTEWSADFQSALSTANVHRWRVIGPSRTSDAKSRLNVGAPPRGYEIFGLSLDGEFRQVGQSPPRLGRRISWMSFPQPCPGKSARCQVGAQNHGHLACGRGKAEPIHRHALRP